MSCALSGVWFQFLLAVVARRIPFRPRTHAISPGDPLLRIANNLLPSALIACVAPLLAATPPHLPVPTPGTNIGGGITRNSEPSGAAWHPALQRLFVCGDEGHVASMNRDGSDTINWNFSGNWEAVAVAQLDTPFIYLAKESTGHIREFNFHTGQGARDFDLTRATPTPGGLALTSDDVEALVGRDDNMGVESMAFVRDAGDAEGGLFYVGSEQNGYIYRFRLSLSGGTNVTYVDKFRTWPAADKQLAALEYDWYHDLVIAEWDDTNILRIMTPAGQILHEWRLPAETLGQEGLAFDGSSLYVAEDTAPNGIVLRYSNFPVDRFTLTYSATTGGWIDGPNPQAVEYGWPGSPVTARNATGYHFLGWDDGRSEPGRTESNIRANFAATALFEINHYDIDYAATPHGTLEGPTHQVVDHGQAAQPVLAVPDPGYHFAGWTDGFGSPWRQDSNVQSGIAVAALFSINQYELDYAAAPHGLIQGPAHQVVDHGAAATPVDAQAETGYHFTTWSDAWPFPGRADQDIQGNLRATAYFEINRYRLAYAALEHGILVGPTLQTIDHGAAGMAVLAQADPGYHFAGWSDGTYINPRVDTHVAGPIEVTATFRLNQFLLRYRAGEHGRIEGLTDQLIDLDGSSAPVRAVPDPGYVFLRWSDGLRDDVRSEAHVSADQVYTAVFLHADPVAWILR